MQIRSVVRPAFAAPALVFAVNAWVVWRLFFVEYLNQLPSVEGEFIAMARYIQHHWPGYDWQSLWYAGYPVVRTYQPLVHYVVAAFATVTGLSPAAAFHFIGALSYSLGGVAFYCLAKALSGNRGMALGGALFFSLFSTSAALIPGISHDMGSVWYARRLQALVVYGELPNLTGLMLGMFALGLLHIALTRRNLRTALAAAVMAAAVPATNWPSTVALLIGIVSYCAAMSWSQIRDCLPRLLLIGLPGTAMALPFALPSSILQTYGNANVMVNLPTHGLRRWISEGLLVVCFFLLRYVLVKKAVPFGLRFAGLWLTVLGWVVLSSTVAGVAILPLPLRFHVAFEIPVCLALMFLVWQLRRSRVEARRLMILAFSVFCCFQMFHYRRHAHAMIHKLDITQTLEYQEAKWFEANMQGERVMTPGTIQFWMNVFTDTPQLSGCCEQSVPDHEKIIASYITTAGFEDDAKSADYSLLWMKAFAVHAVAISSPNSREFYKDFLFPKRFEGRLPRVWSSGDDAIYRVPERVPGLARVVWKKDLVVHPPANGVDAAELRTFVAALDDTSLPVASWLWKDDDSASIRATLGPDHLIAVSLNYHPGWKALVSGKPVPVYADGLGFMVVEPHCSGLCAIELHWSSGAERRVVGLVALIALAGFGAVCLLRRKQDTA